MVEPGWKNLHEEFLRFDFKVLLENSLRFLDIDQWKPIVDTKLHLHFYIWYLHTMLTKHNGSGNDSGVEWLTETERPTQSNWRDAQMAK